MRFARFCLLLILGLGMTFGRPVHAHAIITEAVPAINATVIGPDLPVRLKYNSRIDHGRSKLTLYPADGAGQPVAVAKDLPPDVLGGDAHGLTKGNWRLRWQVLSVDGHITRGDIPFTVN